MWRSRGGVIPRLPIGSTMQGAAAALKALHPAADVGPQRWPDHATQNSVVIQNTDVYLVPPPINRDGEETWNLNLYLVPFTDNTCLTTRYWTNPVSVNKPDNPSLEDFSKSDCVTLYSSPWNKTNSYPQDDYMSARVTARSLTVDLVASGLYDQGVLYAGQMTLDVKPLPARSTTVTEVLAKLKELGIVKSTAAADELDSETVDETANLEVFQAMPDTPQQLMQADPKAYMSIAKNGVYIPLRHQSQTLPYEECSQEYQLVCGNPTDPTGRWGHHVMHGNAWQLGVVMLRGIDYRASVSMKIITCLELAPKADSSLARLVQAAPTLDQDCLDKVQEVMCRMPHAFPSKANALGTIVAHIAEALGDSGIPIVSQIGKGVVGVNRALGGAPVKFLDSIF